MTKTFTRIALAAAAVGAIALPASNAMAGTSKTESALLGGLLGAIAGGAVGHGKTEGVVLGAAAGAALGVAVDASNDRNHNYRSGRAYRDARPYHRDTRYATQYAPRYDRDTRWSQDRYGYGSSYGSGYDGYGYDSYGYDSYGYRR